MGGEEEEGLVEDEESHQIWKIHTNVVKNGDCVQAC